MNTVPVPLSKDPNFADEEASETVRRAVVTRDNGEVYQSDEHPYDIFT